MLTEEIPPAKVKGWAGEILGGELLVDAAAESGNHGINMGLKGGDTGRGEVLGDGLLDAGVFGGANLGEDVEEELAVNHCTADRVPVGL